MKHACKLIQSAAFLIAAALSVTVFADEEYDALIASISEKVERNKHADAADDFELLIAHLKQAAPDGDERTVTALAEYAQLLDRWLFRRREAVQTFREALDLHRRLSPPNETTVTILIQFASASIHAGDLDSASRLLDEALKTIEKVGDHGDRELHEASALQLLAGIRHHRGDYENALDLFEKAAELLRGVVRKDPSRTARRTLADTLNNFGGLYVSLEDTKKALPLLTEARRMYAELYPDDEHESVAIVETSLGTCLFGRGDFAGAIQHFEQAIRIYRRILPPELQGGHLGLAAAIGNRGLIPIAMNRVEEALRYFTQSLDQLKQAFPANEFPFGSVPLADAHRNVGVAHVAARRHGAATDAFLQSTQTHAGLAEFLTPAMSEPEAMNFVSMNQIAFSLLLTSWPEANQPDDGLYGPFWDYRSLVLRMVFERQSVWDQLPAGDARKLLEEYRRLRAKFAAQPDLTAAKEQLERELSRLIPGFQERMARQKTSAADLKGLLPEGSIFIDFVRYQKLKFVPQRDGPFEFLIPAQTAHYAAFVMQPQTDIRFVQLGPCQDIDAAIIEWLRGIRDKEPSPAAHTLREVVWSELAREFEAGNIAEREITPVFLCPDDWLSFIPWAALPVDDNYSGVLHDRFVFATQPFGHYLAQHLRPDEPPDLNWEKALAVYNVEPAEGEEPLNATLEIERLRADCGDCKLFDLDGPDARVEAVLAALPDHRALHFSVHGKYPSAEEGLKNAMREEEGGFMNGRRRVDPQSRHPLTLSSLILTHGEVLSAEAIASQPLSGVDLVVLSACGPEGGIPVTGEGTYGLQRAFHQAGARTVVTTLWETDEGSAEDFMDAFYEVFHGDRLIGRFAPLMAMHEAQTRIRERDGDDYSLRRVQNWAGWSLGGDPGLFPWQDTPKPAIQEDDAVEEVPAKHDREPLKPGLREPEPAQPVPAPGAKPPRANRVLMWVQVLAAVGFLVLATVAMGKIIERSYRSR